jgi:hypothetical protein
MVMVALGGACFADIACARSEVPCPLLS